MYGCENLGRGRGAYKQKRTFISVFRRNLAINFMASYILECLKVARVLNLPWEFNSAKQTFKYRLYARHSHLLTFSKYMLKKSCGMTNMAVVPLPMSDVTYRSIYQPSKILQCIHRSVDSQSKSQCGCHWRAWIKALDKLHCLFYSNCSVYFFRVCTNKSPL